MINSTLGQEFIPSSFKALSGLSLDLVGSICKELVELKPEMDSLIVLLLSWTFHKVSWE